MSVNRRCVSAWKESPLSVVVCQDGAIFKSELKAPVCILIPIRLGLDTINPKYVRFSAYVSMFGLTVEQLG
jgi:hypothetical protein